MLLQPLLLVLVGVKGCMSSKEEVAADKELTLVVEEEEVTSEGDSSQNTVHLVFPAQLPQSAVRTGCKKEKQGQKEVPLSSEKEILFPARHPNMLPAAGRKNPLFNKSLKMSEKTQQKKKLYRPNIVQNYKGYPLHSSSFARIPFQRTNFYHPKKVKNKNIKTVGLD